MPLVAAKCTQCGANLEIDNSVDAAVCPNCRTPYVTEKAITNYNTYQQSSYEIQHANIQLNDEKSIENRLKNAEVFFTKHKDYLKAESLFIGVTDDAPDDYRGWWGIARVTTQEFSVLTLHVFKEAKTHVDRALNVAPPDILEQLKLSWSDYERKVEQVALKSDESTNKVRHRLSDIENQLSKNEELIKNNREMIGKINVKVSRSDSLGPGICFGFIAILTIIAVISDGFLMLFAVPIFIGLPLIVLDRIRSWVSCKKYKAEIAALEKEISEIQSNDAIFYPQIREAEEAIELAKGTGSEDFERIRNATD